MERAHDVSHLVRFILTDGASIIASCEPAMGLGGGRATMVTLTRDETVERIPLGSLDAILPWDAQVPMPSDTAVYRFAMIP